MLRRKGPIRAARRVAPPRLGDNEANESFVVKRYSGGRRALEFPGFSGDAAGAFVGRFELLWTEPSEVAVTSRSIVEGIDVVSHIACPFIGLEYRHLRCLFATGRIAFE